MSGPTGPGKEQELRERILAGSEDPEDYKALAELLLESPGRENEGLAVLERALELPLPDIGRAEISAELAWFLYESGQIDRARALAQRTLTWVDGQLEGPEILMIRGVCRGTLANCLYTRDRAESDRESGLALESLERFISQYPDNENLMAACLYASGLYMLREDYGKAVVLHEGVLRRAPSELIRLDSLVWLGNALRCQGRHGEAEARLRQALELIEYDRRYLPRIFYELGKVHRLTGRSHEALNAFEEAAASLELAVNYRGYRSMVAEIRWELGGLYYDAGKYGEAISAFRAALSDLVETLPSLYTDALLTLGHSYLITRQYKMARDCYEEVLAAGEASEEQKAVAREGLSRLPSIPPQTIH